MLPGRLATWNRWTDFSDPQDFLEQSRAHGHTTIGAAVDAYVVEVTGMRRAWGLYRRGVLSNTALLE